MSVVEEVLVKRFRVVEEVHLVRERNESVIDDEVALRRTAAEVSRD